jgi:hypothetical protein
MKTEPNADLRQAAATMWQMYTALTDEGFSERQALEIMSNVLRGAFRNNTTDD